MIISSFHYYVALLRLDRSAAEGPPILLVLLWIVWYAPYDGSVPDSRAEVVPAEDILQLSVRLQLAYLHIVILRREVSRHHKDHNQVKLTPTKATSLW